MNIGVFDSGKGGEFVLARLQRDMPENNYQFVSDTIHLPYGNKSEEEIRTLTEFAIEPLLKTCPIIVIACNTATAAAIDYLRGRYPSTTFVGVEPMVKPAAYATKTRTIAICATPATLDSERYQKLKLQYAPQLLVLEPDCSDWAERIEHNELDINTIGELVTGLVTQGADVISLSCTHYIGIKDLVQSMAGNGVTVLEPSEALSRRVQDITAAYSQPQ